MSTNVASLRFVGIDETSPVARNIAASVDHLTNRFGGMAKTMLASFAGLASVGLLKNKFDELIAGAAALDDISERTGIAVERLSAFSSVLKVGGHDMGYFEGSLLKMTKGLAGTEEETKGAGRALSFLGIQSRDAAGNMRPMDAIMMDVAKRFDEFKDGPGKSAIAMDLWGKSGAGMINIMKDLVENGEAVASITTEQAAAAEKYEKDVKRLMMAKESLAKKIAMDVLPVAQDFVTMLLDLQKQTKATQTDADKLNQSNAIQEWARRGAMGVAYLIDAARAVPVVFELVGKAIAAIAMDGSNFMAGMSNAAAAAVAIASGRAAEGVARMAESKASFAQIGQGVRMFGEDLDAITAKFTNGSFAQALDRTFEESAKKMAAAPEAAKQALDGYVGSTEKAKEATDGIAKQIDAIILKIAQRSAEQTRELALGRELTQAEKQREDVLQQLAANQDLNTAASKRGVRAMLDQLVALEAKANAEKKEFEAYRQFMQEIAKFEEEAAKKKLAGRDAVEEYIDSIRLETQMVNASNIEREVTIRLLALEKAGVEKGSEVWLEYGRQIREALGNKEIAENAKKARDDYTAVWKGIGDDITNWIMGGFKNTRDMLKKMFSELVLRPIISPIGQALSGGLSALFGGGGGGGGAGAMGGIVSLFSAGGSAMSSLFGSTAFGGSMLGGMANLASAFTAGGFGGAISAIGAGVSGGLSGIASGALMSGLGQMAGSLIPVIGPLIAVGMLAAKFFKNKDGLWFDIGDDYAAKAKDPGRVINTELGKITAVGEYKNNADFKPFADQLVNLSKNFVDIFGEEIAVKARAAVGSWTGYSGRGKGTEYKSADEYQKALASESKDVMAEFFSRVFSVVDTSISDTISSWSGTTEELTQYIQGLLLAQTALTEIRKTLPQLTFSLGEFAAMTKEQQQAFLTIAATLPSLSQSVGDMVKDILNQANEGILGAIMKQGDAMRTLVADFAAGKVGIEALAAASTAMAQAQQAAAQKIAEVQQRLRQTIDQARENYLLGGMTKEEQYAYYQKQTDAEYLKLAEATSVEQIDAITQKILGYMAAANGLLTEEERTRLSPDYIAGLDKVDALSQARLNAAADQVTALGKSIGDAVLLALAEDAKARKEIADQDRETADINMDAALTPRTFNVNVNLETGTVGVNMREGA